MSSATARAPITLINGDRVLLSPAPGGQHEIAVLRVPGEGLAASLMTLRLGTKVFLIPRAALPYLGRSLDLRLFELSALERAERDGRLPVIIRYRGHQRPALPGIAVTGAGAGTEHGYLTAASAVAFGAALARQFLADHARGSYGHDGMLAGGVLVSLAGAPAQPPQPSPRFPMHTLTVTGTNLAGKPDTGDEVAVISVNDVAATGSPGSGTPFSFFYHGTARFSVPSGTYWAVGGFDQVLDHGLTDNIRLDVLPQFTVTGNTTVHVAARAAASKVSVVTPRASVMGVEELQVIRTAGSQFSNVSAGIAGFGIFHGSLWINQTRRRPADGTLRTSLQGVFLSPPGPGIPYAYTLDLPGPAGIIGPQHYVVRPDDLATVRERYFQDTPVAPLNADWCTLAGTVREWETSIRDCASAPLRVPGPQVQYISARPATLDLSSYGSQNSPPLPLEASGQVDAFRLLHGGMHLTVDWNRYPLHPAPNVSLPGNIFPTLPSAARSGNTLMLDITPFGDNQFGHTGVGFAGFGVTAGTYALYQNGVKIAGGDAVKAAQGRSDLRVHARLRPQPSVIRFILTAHRPGYRLSPASRDVWTWRSRPDPAATVPAPWYCGVTSSGRPDRHCVVQPMLTLRYRVAGLGLTGATRPGPQALGVTVAAPQEAAPATITHATVRVSFDGGRTWQQARVRRAGASGFRALFTAPSSRGVTLRVTARDAAGATVTETISNAYRTSA